MRWNNGALLFGTFQVLVFTILRLQLILCQSDADDLWLSGGPTRHPHNKRIVDSSEISSADALSSRTPISNTVQTTTEIDDSGIPLYRQKSVQTPTNLSTSTKVNTVSSSSTTDSTEDDIRKSVATLSSMLSQEESTPKMTTLQQASEETTSESEQSSVEHISPTKDIPVESTRSTKDYGSSQTTNHETMEVPKGITNDLPAETSTLSTRTETISSTIARSVEQATSAKNVPEVPVYSPSDVNTASSSEEKTPGYFPVELSTKTDSMSSPVARPLIQSTSEESITSQSDVTTSRSDETLSEDNNLSPGFTRQTTMSHSTRLTGNTFPLVSESWSEPSTRNDYTSPFLTSNAMTNNHYRTSRLTDATTLHENHITSSESPEYSESPEVPTVTDDDITTYATEPESVETEQPAVLVPEQTNSTQLFTMTMTTATTTQPEVTSTTMEPEQETTTEIPLTTSTQTPSTTMQEMEFTDSPILPNTTDINVTETVLPVISDQNVTTTEAIATTERELEPYKYHEHLTNEENNNAVTVIFHVPPEQKMDVFWSIDRNRKFRIAVTDIINMETSNGQVHRDSNPNNDSDVQMDQPRKPLATWLSPDDLVYISPSPVAENRTIYVAFFISNSSIKLYTIVPADKIVDALKANKPVLEEEMGLNVTQITKGIILVKVVQPFFVRHAIIIISLLGVAVFCILVIIIALICIRCRSSRRWDRGEYDDKNKLKQDMKMNREIGDLNNDHDIQNDEMTEKSGYPYVNGNGMHVISLADEGWVVPMDQPPPLPPKPHTEIEDTKL